MEQRFYGILLNYYKNGGNLGSNDARSLTPIRRVALIANTLTEASLWYFGRSRSITRPSCVHREIVFYVCECFVRYIGV